MGDCVVFFAVIIRSPMLRHLIAWMALAPGALVPGAALAHQGHNQQRSGQDGVNALYATKGEAEAAAKRFHCTGTHQMGDKWMPCAMKGDASGH